MSRPVPSVERLLALHFARLFKGGTSLSKAFGLVNRFSEDIDITVFRQDLGEPISIEDLEQLSRKKRSAKLDEIREACRQYLRQERSEAHSAWSQPAGWLTGSGATTTQWRE